MYIVLGTGFFSEVFEYLVFTVFLTDHLLK